MKLYDKNAVAKFLDMTPKNVERLTSKGVLQTIGETKLYSLTEANRAYIRYLRDRNPETEEAVDLNEERAKLTKAKRLNEELDLALKRGELHKAEDVKKIMSATLINFKSRLSAIPAEEADKLATMTDKAKIFLYLNTKIKEALAELSNFEEIFKEEIQALRRTAQRSSYEGIENIINALDRAKKRLDSNVNFELVMELLMLNKGKFLSSEDLLTKVWGYDTEVELGTVWVYISCLRKKLAKLDGKLVIQAKRNIGYKLEVRE